MDISIMENVLYRRRIFRGEITSVWGTVRLKDYMCVCVCVCADREREGKEKRLNNGSPL